MMKTLSGFLGNARGNVALMFALSAVPAMGVVGLAVDYSRSITAEQRLQKATDAGALAFAASSADTFEERRQHAVAVVMRNLPTNKGIKVNSPSDVQVVVEPDGNIKVSVDTKIKTTLMKIFGYADLSVKSVSYSRRSGNPIEVAMALDISGSMMAGMTTGTRLQVMKQSAKKLVDILYRGADGVDQIKFGIVPFHENVNVGTGNASFVTGTNHALFTGTSWAGCVMERPVPFHNADSYVPSNTSPNGKWHAYITPPEPNGNSAGYCKNPSNGKNDGYAALETNAAGAFKTMTPGPNFNCVRHSMLPLTSNRADIENKLDSLTAEFNNGTIIAPGVSWANRILSPGEPFTEGRRYDDQVQKILIILTDGEQTTEGEHNTIGCNEETNNTAAFKFDPADFKLKGGVLSGTGPRDQFSPYGYILDSDPFNSGAVDFTSVKNTLHSVSLDACNEAKKTPPAGKPVIVYTIAVSTSAGPGTKVHDLLRACASAPDKFFYAEDAAAVENAFKEIGKNVLNVRLTR